MSFDQSDRRVTFTLSSRGLSAGDSIWTGSIDGDGRIAASWQQAVGTNTVTFYCTNDQVRRVVLRSATASLRYPQGGTAIEGTIVTRSDVTDLQGALVAQMTDTTSEYLERE